MRGVSAIAIILIIVVLGVLAYFALQFLPTLTRQPTVVVAYKNDIITVEDLYVSNLKPYEGTDVDIRFLVSNNGDQPAKNVVVKFESTGGGFGAVNGEVFSQAGGCEPSLLTCSNKPLESQVKLKCGSGRLDCTVVCRTEGQGSAKTSTYFREWDKCVFEKIDSLDSKPVSFTSSALNVFTDTVYNIKYSVQYDYSGSRLATIPVIDFTTITKPFSKFSQSTPTYGPLVLEFQPGDVREFTEAGKKVTGYWLEYGRAAEVKLSLKNIGSSSTGVVTENDIDIKEGTFTLDTKGTLTPSGFCHFRQNEKKNDGLFYYCRNTEIVSGSQGACNFEQPMRDAKLPAQLSCNFQPAQQLTAPETSATILANFDYTYKFTRTQPIAVKDIKGA